MAGRPRPEAAAADSGREVLGGGHAGKRSRPRARSPVCHPSHSHLAHRCSWKVLNRLPATLNLHPKPRIRAGGSDVSAGTSAATTPALLRLRSLNAGMVLAGVGGHRRRFSRASPSPRPAISRRLPTGDPAVRPPDSEQMRASNAPAGTAAAGATRPTTRPSSPPAGPDDAARCCRPGDDVRCGHPAHASKLLWYLTRGSGLVCLVLLTASVVLGIATTVRVSAPRWPRFLVAALHRNVSLFVMVVLAFHIAVAVLDSYAPIGWVDARHPVHSSYRPVWLGLGALSLDLLLAVIVTSLLRDRLGHRRWRAVHWAAYASWLSAVVPRARAPAATRRRPWVLVAHDRLRRQRRRRARPASGRSAGRRIGGCGCRPREWRSSASSRSPGWVKAGPLRPGWARAAGTPALAARKNATPAPVTRRPVLTRPFSGSPFRHGSPKARRTARARSVSRLDMTARGSVPGSASRSSSPGSRRPAVASPRPAAASPSRPTGAGTLDRIAQPSSTGSGSPAASRAAPQTLILRLDLTIDPSTGAISGELHGRPA